MSQPAPPVHQPSKVDSGVTVDATVNRPMAFAASSEKDHTMFPTDSQPASSHVISVLSLDRKDVKELRIVDRYGIHRAVYSLFDPLDQPATVAQASGGASSQILYFDSGTDDLGRRQVLILSNRPPRSLRVFDRYGQVQSKPLPEAFFDHHQFRFSLDVNATRKQAGKRVPIRGREGVLAWILAHQQEWGVEFDEPSMQVEKIQVVRLAKGLSSEATMVTFSQASVSGALQVVDRTRFLKAVLGGVGRARAFGCGLWRLKPVRPKTENGLDVVSQAKPNPAPVSVPS